MSRTAAPLGVGTMTGSFVYVIRGSGNHHKIGVSTDPIARLAALQTASHEILDFAYVGVTPGTGFAIERAAHDLLAAYRASGEWFAVPASIATGAVIEAASRAGEPIQQVAPHMVPEIIRIAQSAAAPPARRVPRFMWWTLGILVAMLITLIAIAIFVPEPVKAAEPKCTSMCNFFDAWALQKLCPNLAFAKNGKEMDRDFRGFAALRQAAIRRVSAQADHCHPDCLKQDIPDEATSCYYLVER